MPKYRTHTCGELTKKDQEKSVKLAGWVQSRRDHGGFIFLDLRDRYGLTQLTFDPKNKDSFKAADGVRPEYVIGINGVVKPRPQEMINKKLKTGEIEVDCKELTVYNTSKTPPFPINQKTGINEEIRLKYRFLDLRNERLQKIILDRDKVITYIREYFHKLGFIDIQTPILANSSPEGARDYLVPSRLYPGKFYALPQAPQQFKQLLMVAGFDKYFQIAPCFRDEDPRSDRHPGSFYQIDLEMSFVEQEDVWKAVEPLMIEITEKFSDKKIVTKPFPRLTYKEVMSTYGSDKPDLRFDIKITDVSELFKKTDFKVFKEALEDKGVVYAMKVDGGGRFSRKENDELAGIATEKGAKGLAYIVYADKPKSPILKFMSDNEVKNLQKKTGAKKGDIVFFGADKWRTASESLGVVREECGRKLKLKDSGEAAWLWIHDYPMYDYSEIEPGKIDFSHNPFSMPQGGMKALEGKDPLDILGYQYDLVCNGFEISSGAIRNNQPEIMYKAFSIAGYSKEEVDKKFGHMIRAFEYGAPPHGGFAPGLDRLLMVLWECSSIRDIYAFPKNGKAQDAMLGSPSEVSDKQLKELHLKIDKPSKK